MLRILIALLVGLVLGGALVFYFFVRVPQAIVAPGVQILPPDPAGMPSGTAQVVLRQEFFNNVLETIFRDMRAPAFPLGQVAGQTVQGDEQACRSEITILREGSGVKTELRFDNNLVSAPLAFSGSYNSFAGCFQFTGWTQSNLSLRYDASQQAVFGQINVEAVNLDGVNPIVSGFVTPLVQTTLNNRVNPITIIDGKQIAIFLPIAATNGNLQATVNDVRAEVKDNALNLHMIYDFKGLPTQ